MLTQIILLAMLAAFLGLRLYSVLGRRAEHEDEGGATNFEKSDDKEAAPAAVSVVQPIAEQSAITGFPPAIEVGLRDIAASDRRFDLMSFLEGGKAAYGMVLEAFWRGDKEELAELCDDDVLAGFSAAIDEREAAGHVMDNTLIRIEDTTVHSAMLDGKLAQIAVRFVADIASVTRDKDGVMIAGSLDDAIESRDVWTFSRDLTSDSPAWLLDETDEG